MRPMNTLLIISISSDSKKRVKPSQASEHIELHIRSKKSGILCFFFSIKFSHADSYLNAPFKRFYGQVNNSTSETNT